MPAERAGRVVVPRQAGPVTPPRGAPRHAAPDDEPGAGPVAVPADSAADSAAGGAVDRVGAADPDFAAVHRSPEFADVRRRLHRFVFPVTAGFLLWYLLFVALSAFAPGLMAVPVLGVINLGTVLGLLQFVSTLVIVAAYLRYARTHLDPRVRALRSAYEGRARERIDPAASTDEVSW